MAALKKRKCGEWDAAEKLTWGTARGMKDGEGEKGRRMAQGTRCTGIKNGAQFTVQGAREYRTAKGI
jgi:hypothetical protein